MQIFCVKPFPVSERFPFVMDLDYLAEHDAFPEGCVYCEAEWSQSWVRLIGTKRMIRYRSIDLLSAGRKLFGTKSRIVSVNRHAYNGDVVYRFADNQVRLVRDTDLEPYRFIKRTYAWFYIERYMGTIEDNLQLLGLTETLMSAGVLYDLAVSSGVDELTNILRSTIKDLAPEEQIVLRYGKRV